MPYDYDLVYHCDSYPEIGNGHLKRGLDVAHALLGRDPNLQITFYGRYSESAQRFMNRFLDPKVTVLSSEQPMPGARVSVLDTLHREGDPSWFDPERTRQVKGGGERFVIISSGLRVELPVTCNLFIDHLPDVTIEGEQPRETHLGFEYAPVAAEFFERAAESEVDRPGALVAVFGGGPVQDGPDRIAETFYTRAISEFPGFVMVLSPHFPRERALDLLQRYPDLELLQNVPSVAPLLQTAGAVICTYGNITYEALSCGKPVFLASYLEFQNEYGAYLEEKKLAVNLGTFASLDAKKSELVFDPVHRETAAERAGEMFQRPGIEAIADALLEQLKHT